MALPVNRPDNEITASAYMADLSTAGSAFVAAPAKGRLVRAQSCIYNAITTANATWSIEVNGVAVTGTVTVTQSGSAAGDVDSVEYTTDVRVNEGDTIEFISGGESDTTTPTMFTAVIRVG